MVHYTTSCKHSLGLLRMGETIARNMLSWLELLIKRYCCIQLVVYIIVLEMHGHAKIKSSMYLTWNKFLFDSIHLYNFISFYILYFSWHVLYPTYCFYCGFM